MKKYQKRRTYELKLSERQLEQISAFKIIASFIGRYWGAANKLEDLPNINPKWIKQQRYKKLDLWHMDELRKTGTTNFGIFTLRKAKKGYVLEMKFNWRSKGIKSKELICGCCKKSKLVNWAGICEKCEKFLKSKRKYKKFFFYGGKL